MATRVFVLKGGISAEKEVSLASAAACERALQAAGYEIFPFDAACGIADMVSVLQKWQPDVIFNALHGKPGEDGSYQGIFDLLQIPYTHSGCLASALAMDKARAKQIFESAAIPVVTDQVLAYRDLSPESIEIEKPFVIKPVAEGSSVGIAIVQQNDPVERAIEQLPETVSEYLVEKYIPGRELTCTIMGGEPLCVTEIQTQADFYDYDAKYQTGGSAHICPADLPSQITEAVLHYSLKAYQALGCSGIARADFRYDDLRPGNPENPDGRLFILEVNTQPGMTETSLVPEQAAAKGILLPQLVSWMVEDALCGGQG